MLLTKTNQLNNNESRKTNSKKTVSCRLTKMETMKITTRTVDWIPDLNITINSWKLLLFLSFLFLLNYSSFRSFQTQQHNLVLNAIHFSMSSYGMKNIVSCFIFSTLQNELIQRTSRTQSPTEKNCSLYDWYIKIQLMILMI